PTIPSGKKTAGVFGQARGCGDAQLREFPFVFDRRKTAAPGSGKVDLQPRVRVADPTADLLSLGILSVPLPVVKRGLVDPCEDGAEVKLPSVTSSVNACEDAVEVDFPLNRDHRGSTWRAPFLRHNSFPPTVPGQ